MYICEYTKCTQAHISTRLLNQRMCRRVLCRRVSVEMDTCTYVPFEYTHVHSFMIYQVVFRLAYTLRCLSRHEVLLSYKNRLKMPHSYDIAFLLSHAFIRNDDTSPHILFIGNLNLYPHPSLSDLLLCIVLHGNGNIHHIHKENVCHLQLHRFYISHRPCCQQANF